MIRPPALAAVALALSGSAYAHDYSADIVCRVTESDGQRSAWSFATNTVGADGAPLSTFVETSYLGHGKSVVSQAGSRPVWFMAPNRMGGMTLLPQSNPGWSLVVSNVSRSGPTVLEATRRSSITAPWSESDSARGEPFRQQRRSATSRRSDSRRIAVTSSVPNRGPPVCERATWVRQLAFTRNSFGLS